MQYNSPTPQEAPFNMALATLEALRSTLNRIEEVARNTWDGFEVNQRTKLLLVRHFFITATPLLPKQFMDDNQNKILDLKMEKSVIMQKRYGNTPINKGMAIIYSVKLEKTLDELLIKIQRSLQDSGYFMPPKKDLTKTVTQF